MLMLHNPWSFVDDNIGCRKKNLNSGNAGLYAAKSRQAEMLSDGTKSFCVWSSLISFWLSQLLSHYVMTGPSSMLMKISLHKDIAIWKCLPRQAAVFAYGPTCESLMCAVAALMRAATMLVQDSSDMRYLAARLMPTWQDSFEEQQQQYPALLGLTADQAMAVQQQRMPTDEPSFNAWARLLRISPTGAVDNLMQAMENMSVTQHAKQHGKLLEDEARVQAEPVEV